MTELLRRSAVDLAALVRVRELSARELVQASLDRIAALDRRINAFTHVAAEAALAQADALDALAPDAGAELTPFAGVPIAIKDNRAVAGMPVSHGSQLFAGVVADHDDHVVRRLREAGFVIVGKTALPEMAILPTTESRRFGPTANPWALDRTPGGSSGGSAAAVAAGMVPIAHGNDGGGSIRIPAACCGLVGLKPARGRVPAGPDAGHSFLAGDGVLTRDVRDTAAVLDVIAGYEPGDATWAPPPSVRFADACDPAAQPAVGAGGVLRVGLALDPPYPDTPVDPACAAAARDAAGLLASVGHDVEQVEPPWASGDALPAFTRAFGPLISLTTRAGERRLGRELVAGDVEPLTWELWQLARRQDTLTYLAAQNRLERLARAVVEFMLDFDVVITPALGMRPVPTGTIHGRGPDPMGHYERSGAFTPFTAIINVTGQPAISVPLYQGEDGLPTAVQLIGPPAGEDVVLAVAAELERALPWHDRVPIAADS